MKIKLLDCTLRDGAYITESFFGTNAIKGIISNLIKAKINMIEVGWLKNNEHKEGSTYYKHVEDIIPYLPEDFSRNLSYIAMIDYGRYDLDNLSEYNGKSINTIREVFPREKFEEAIDFSKQIKQKGYNLCLQAANTASYSDMQLLRLADKVNEVMPDSISIVDTFGTMYENDLQHIFMILDKNLDKKINIGFHSHNNLQLSFALSMSFVKFAQETGRNIVIDSSLCGMGRGAGNTCTELITNYLNKMNLGNYDTNLIMDTIDIYMQYFIENYKWGYSIPLCIAGQLGSHVNNIAYLLNTHKTSCRDIKIILESLPKDERKLYNYDNLEKAYLDYQNKEVNDTKALNTLSANLSNKDVLLIIPGKSVKSEQTLIKDFISKVKPVVIGVNSVSPLYEYDYLFFTNQMRFNYALEQFGNVVKKSKVILTSNIHTNMDNENVFVINYNTLIKLGWKYFDNSTIMALRLLSKLNAKFVNFAGFDGYYVDEDSAYDDILLKNNISNAEKIELNNDIRSMLEDFVAKDKLNTGLRFVTKSQFEDIIDHKILMDVIK